MRSASAICCVAGRSGMAADEEQAQNVVAIIGAVEALGEIVLGIAEIGDLVLGRQRLVPAAPAAPGRSRHCARRRSARRRDRAAGRSPARSSAPSGRPPERPPRRCRDRGNSAAARRSPGAGLMSARPRSKPCHSCSKSLMPVTMSSPSQPRSGLRRRAVGGGRRSRPVGSDRTQLVGAARIGGGELLGRLQRLVEAGALDDIEAEQLLLGLGEGPVDDQRRVLRSCAMSSPPSSAAAAPPVRAGPDWASLPCTTASFCITASSSAFDQAPTTSSEW